MIGKALLFTIIYGFAGAAAYFAASFLLGA
jgi:hypothetical protein